MRRFIEEAPDTALWRAIELCLFFTISTFAFFLPTKMSLESLPLFFVEKVGGHDDGCDLTSLMKLGTDHCSIVLCIPNDYSTAHLGKRP